MKQLQDWDAANGPCTNCAGSTNLKCRFRSGSADLTAIKNLLIPDIVAWGAAAIGLALTASAVLWVMQIVRSAYVAGQP